MSDHIHITVYHRHFDLSETYEGFSEAFDHYGGYAEYIRQFQDNPYGPEVSVAWGCKYPAKNKLIARDDPMNHPELLPAAYSAMSGAEEATRELMNNLPHVGADLRAAAKLETHRDFSTRLRVYQSLYEGARDRQTNGRAKAMRLMCQT